MTPTPPPVQPTRFCATCGATATEGVVLDGVAYCGACGMAPLKLWLVTHPSRRTLNT